MALPASSAGGFEPESWVSVFYDQETVTLKKLSGNFGLCPSLLAVWFWRIASPLQASFSSPWNTLSRDNPVQIRFAPTHDI